MNRDWAAADEAVAFAIGLEGAWRERAKGYVNRAIDAFMADGLRPEGPDYEQFGTAMCCYSTLKLHDAARFPGSGWTMAGAAAELEQGLYESRELLADLAARMRDGGHDHVAALADEMSDLAAELAARL